MNSFARELVEIREFEQELRTLITRTPYDVARPRTPYVIARPRTAYDVAPVAEGPVAADPIMTGEVSFTLRSLTTVTITLGSFSLMLTVETARRETNQK